MLLALVFASNDVKMDLIKACGASSDFVLPES